MKRFALSLPGVQPGLNGELPPLLFDRGPRKSPRDFSFFLFDFLRLFSLSVFLPLRGISIFNLISFLINLVLWFHSLSVELGIE